MSDKAVPFFDPTDVLSLGGTWVQQENNLAEFTSRAQGLGATGDEVAKQLHDSGTRGTIVYEDHTASGFLTLPLVGEVKGGYHIDSWQLVYNQTGWPRLTVTVHQHDQNVHADTELNEFKTTIKWPAQFGIPRSLVKLSDGVTVVFSNGDTDSGMREMTGTLSATHVDENDGGGDHLAGENRDGMETLSVGFTKEPSSITIHADYDEMTDGTPKSNTAAQTGQMSWENHLARE